MRRLLTTASLVLATFTLAGHATAQVSARIWIDNEREYYRGGDRLNVGFSVSSDSYVAVAHIDTDGNLDFLYPSSPWDNQFVRGGSVNYLATRGLSRGMTLRGTSGIGYFYIIASPDPLDFSYFRGRVGSSWDWGYAGRSVHGDPFLAFDQVARLLMPAYPYARYVFDYYGYQVGGIHRYPTYACYSQGSLYDSGWGWYPGYDSCSRVDYFLRQYPYYYDTRRYRGDRRAYLRQYERIDPRYGFKEAPDQPGSAIRTVDPRPAQGVVAVPRREPVSSQPSARPQPQARPAEPQNRAPAQSPPPASTGSGRERPAPSIGVSSPSSRSATATQGRSVPEADRYPATAEPTSSAGTRPAIGSTTRSAGSAGVPAREQPQARPTGSANPPPREQPQARPAAGATSEPSRPAATGSAAPRERPAPSTGATTRSTGSTGTARARP